MQSQLELQSLHICCSLTYMNQSFLMLFLLMTPLKQRIKLRNQKLTMNAQIYELWETSIKHYNNQSKDPSALIQKQQVYCVFSKNPTLSLAYFFLIPKGEKITKLENKGNFILCHSCIYILTTEITITTNNVRTALFQHEPQFALVKK